MNTTIILQVPVMHIPKELNCEKIKYVWQIFSRNFESEIYRYTKHSHRARWKDLQFKHSHEIFPVGTILSVVDFAENYTFTAQKEIQSEYYHFDQVLIFFHVLYKSCVKIEMWLKNITFISAMIIHAIHILFNIVLNFFL